MSQPTLSYDKAARKGTITFPNGHQLRIGNVDEKQAQEFFDRHAAEFMKRDCMLQTAACFEVRHG